MQPLVTGIGNDGKVEVARSDCVVVVAAFLLADGLDEVVALACAWAVTTSHECSLRVRELATEFLGETLMSEYRVDEEVPLSRRHVICMQRAG